MRLRQWLSPPRRTLTVFFAMTVALAVALGVVSWWLVEQDRDVEQQRARQRLGRDVDLLTISIRNWLNEIDLKLAGVASQPDALSNDAPTRDLSWVGADSALVSFSSVSSVRAWPTGRLAYYPHVKQGTDRTIETAASALLRQARDLRVTGRAEEALVAYGRLAAIDGRIDLFDAPATVVARHARAAMLEELARPADLRSEAEALAAAIRGRPSQLTRGAYNFYADAAGKWLGSSGIAIRSDDTAQRELLAAAAKDLWDQWQRTRSQPGARPRSDRRVIRVGDQAVVAIVRVDDRGLVTFIGGDAALREALLGGAKTGADIASLDFGLADATGRFVFGRVPSSSDRVVSTANETGLPWTIYAAHTASAADTNGASTRRRAMLGGAALVGACVLLGGWFTARAMHRELEVARVQSDFVAAVSHEFRTPLAAVATAGSRAATSAGVSWGDGPQTASGYWRGCSGRLAVTIWFWSPSTAAGRA